MHIPFPCPKSLNELKPSKKGFYCSDCKHHLVDMRNPDQPMPPKGSCIIMEEEPEENFVSLNKTYRFALALLIVMGSSIIVNNNVRANEILNKLSEIKEKCIAVDSSRVQLTGQVADPENKAIKPVKITITLSNGDVISEVKFYSNDRPMNFYFEIPKEQINSTITIQYEYYKEVKTLSVTVDKYFFEIPDVVFQRHKKDKYTKKKYPPGRFIGKF